MKTEAQHGARRATKADRGDSATKTEERATGKFTTQSSREIKSPNELTRPKHASMGARVDDMSRASKSM